MLILLMLILPNKGSLKIAMPPRTKPKRLLMLMPIHPSNPPLQPQKQKQQRMGSLKTVRMKPQP